MPKTFPQGAVALTVDAIDALPCHEDLSWRAVAALAKPFCGGVEPSRQWLWKAQAIKDAFGRHQTARAALQTSGNTRKLSTRESDRLLIATLRAEIVKRDAILAAYDQRLAHYLLRAREKGVTQEFLETAAEPVRRGAGSAKKGRGRTKSVGRR